jgi:hypothetical protein
VGAVMLAGVMALSVVGAAATLYALGWLLHRVLVAFPRWIAAATVLRRPAGLRSELSGQRNSIEVQLHPERLGGVGRPRR